MAAVVKQAHYTTRIVKRSDGHSAVAASAYRARVEMTNERTGDVYNYRHGKNDVLFEGVFTPAHAPEWMRDRSQLWNAVEKYEKRKDAQVAKDLIVALSASLTVEQNTRVLKDFIRENFTRKGYIVDVAMHRPDRRGDQRNIHAHLQITMRTLNTDGTWSGKEQFTKGQPPKQDLMDLKERFCKRLNVELAKHGIDEHWEHRSLKDQGIQRAPEQHVGKNGMNLDRDRSEGDRADNLRLIREAHRLRREADKIEREHANANAAARDRANDDAPQIRQGPPAIPSSVAVAQSAIDRLNAEERREQLDALRRMSRSTWATMGDNLRGIYAAFRSLQATMGTAISSIIVGGFLSRTRPVSAAPQVAPGRPPRTARTTPPGRRVEDPLQTLERLAAERKAALQKRAEDTTLEELKEKLRRGITPTKRGPTL